MSTIALRALPSLLLLPLGACSSSRFYDVRFRPAPLEAEIATEAVPGAQVRALVSVVGIERGKDGAPDRALVRMRLENLGTVPAALERESLALVSADLAAFGAASVSPTEAGEVAGGQSAVYDLAFASPEGRRARDLDLSGLNLRFTVRFGEHPVTTGATFQRLEWGYVDPGPRWHIGLGYGWTD